MENRQNFRYFFDESSEILYKYYYGSIKIDDISGSWEYAILNNLIPKEVKGFILDYREASLDIDRRDYIMIPEFYKSHPEVFKNFRIAILLDKPRDIVIPILVMEKDDGYSSKPFSTLDAAIKWVLG